MIGAEVLGVDLREALSAETQKQISDAWLASGNRGGLLGRLERFENRRFKLKLRGDSLGRIVAHSGIKPRRCRYIGAFRFRAPAQNAGLS